MPGGVPVMRRVVKVEALEFKIRILRKGKEVLVSVVERRKVNGTKPYIMRGA